MNSDLKEVLLQTVVGHGVAHLKLLAERRVDPSSPPHFVAPIMELLQGLDRFMQFLDFLYHLFAKDN